MRNNGRAIKRDTSIDDKSLFNPIIYIMPLLTLFPSSQWDNGLNNTIRFQSIRDRDALGQFGTWSSRPIAYLHCYFILNISCKT